MNAKVDLSNVRLETERLFLRAWKLEDLDDFFEYAKVDGIGQMAGWSPHSTIEESRKILNSFIAGKLAMFSANNIGGKDSCRRQ